MKIHLKLLLLMVCSLVLSCKKTEQQPLIMKDLIIGTWQNNYSLDTKEYKHYVPSSQNLGASRYRNFLTFDKDKFTALALSPDDAYYENYGTWSWKDDKTIIAEVTDYKIQSFWTSGKDKSPVIFKFTINVISLEKDKLLLQIKQE